MDKQQAQKELQILEIAHSIVLGENKLEKLDIAKVSFVSAAYQIYLNRIGKEKNELIDSLREFCSSFALSNFIYTSLQEKLTKEAGEEQIKAESETNTVPAELETMVALYQEHQASELDQNKNLTVTDTVKRARKTWLEREKQRIIYQNASDKRQKEIDNERERFYKQSVNSKAESSIQITQNTRKLVEYALAAEDVNLTPTDQKKVIEKVVYLAETGAIDINNNSHLYTATTLAASDYINLKTELSAIDDLVKKQLEEDIIDPYSEKTDEYEAKIADVERNIEVEHNKKSKELLEKLASEENKYDYDTLKSQAKKEQDLVTEKLNLAIPNPKLLLDQRSELDKHAKELEDAIRASDPKILNINPGTVGARVSGTISVTGGNRNVSSTAVDLYSKGLTLDKLEKLESNPNSKVRELLAKNREVRSQIRFQLKQLQNNQLGKEISDNIRPVSGLISGLNPTAQKILSPYQSTKTYVYKQIGKGIGNTIIKNTSSAASKRLGNYILKDGLKKGVKTFTTEALKKGATKIVTWAAVKLGVSLSAESLNAIVPGLGLAVDIAAQIALWLAEKTAGWAINQFKDFYKDITGEDFSLKNTVRDTAIGAGAFLGGAIVLGNTARGFFFATRAAAISALGIIWLSLATMAILLTFTFITAPILTTLVQFDSVEKVNYEELSKPEEDSATCNGKTITNKGATCKGGYCFPVADKNTVSYLTYHHDYPGQDIMRIGDKPGNEDDVPLPILAYTGGVVTTYENDGVGGKSIYLAGDDGRFYWFTHHECNIATNGQRVEAGEIIAGMGSSGNAGGYIEHLHFHMSTKPDLTTKPENYPFFIWPYEDFCRKGLHCGSLNPDVYPELPYL